MKHDTDIKKQSRKMSRDNLEILVEELINKQLTLSNQNIELREKLSKIEQLSKVR